MDKLREKITLRGTVDCPFQQYFQKCAVPDVIITKAHWHPEYEILYIQSGVLELKSDKQVYRLCPGDVAFINPGRIHSIKALGQNNTYYAFVFSLELITLPQTHFFQREITEPIKAGTHQLPPILKAGEPQHSFVADRLEQLILCGKNAPDRKHTIFSSILHIFLHLSPALQTCCDLNHHSNIAVKQALLYMTEHYGERITLQQIADHVHLHPNYLCALFKDYTAQTAFQHLSRIRIEKAAELLKTQPIAISETAALCGFESTGFFTRKFKEQMGIPPKEFSLKHK